MGVKRTVLAHRWPVLASCVEASAWLQIQTDLGLAPRTIEAYARGLADYLAVCESEGNNPLHAGRVEVAMYVRDLAVRPNRRGPNVVAIDSRVGLANATLQQRLVPVRLFYDYLIEEGRRETNPVGRGRYTPGRAFGGQRERGLVPRFTKTAMDSIGRAMGPDFGSGQGRAAAQSVHVGTGVRCCASARGIVLAAHRRSGSCAAHVACARGNDIESP